MVAIAAMMICLGASAIDKVVKKTAMVGEITSMEELQSSRFLLQNADGQLLCTPDGWDIKVASVTDFISANNHGGYYELEALDDNWLIPVYDGTGSRRTFWAGNQYVNSQPAGGNVIFGLDGVNAQHGQDMANGAVWTITYTAGSGFAFHCVGRDVYIGYDNAAARPVEGIVYWKAFKSIEAAYDEAEVNAAKAAVLAEAKNSDVLAAINAAEDIDALAAAINAAIDDIDASKAALSAEGLDAAGTEVAELVVAKYNAGEYKNANEVKAAMAAAYKSQTTAGANMTGAIINPSFEYGSIEGWVSENCGALALNFNFGARTGDKFVERWTQAPGKLTDGKFTQEITGLPNGEYKLTAELQNLEQGNGDAAGKGFFIIANDDATEATEKGGTVAVTTKVEDGTLVVGVKLEGCTGNWICFDNFQLTLVEPEAVVEPIEITPALAFDGEEAALNTKTAVSVEAASSIVVNFENGAAIQTANYEIYELKEVVGDESSTWEPAELVAKGELSINSKGYAEFEKTIYFNQGKKFQLTVVAMNGETELAKEVFEFNGSYVLEPIVAGEFLIQNVETGLFLGAANSWGTQASVMKHGDIWTVATLEDDKYTLKGVVSNGGGKDYLNGTYCDGVATGFTAVEAEGGYALTIDGTNYFTVDATANPIIPNTNICNLSATEINAASTWKFVAKDDAIAALAKASVETPMDATFMIIDNNFGRNNTQSAAWVKKGYDTEDAAANCNISGGSNDLRCAESWRSANGFNISQTVENLPNGWYTLDAQAVLNNYDGVEAGLPVVYANKATTAFTNMTEGENNMTQVATSFMNGLYKVENILVEVTDGTLTVGVKSPLTAIWALWDNFELTYYGAEKPVPAVELGAPAFDIADGSKVSSLEWEGITVSFPDNNFEQAFKADEAFENGAVMLIGTDASLYEEGVEEPIETESFAMVSEPDMTNLFANADIEAGKSYKVVIPAGGLRLVNMMEFMGDFEPCTLWSTAEEITLSFETKAIISETAELTKDMFCEWDNFEANANVVNTGVGDYVLGASTGLPYGDGSVFGNKYADLSEYSVLALTVTEGAPRLLLNRPGMGGDQPGYIEIKAATDKYVLSVEDNVWKIDLAQITADAGYAHLNCIKGANWANTTITEMTLIKSVEEPDPDYSITANLIAEGEDDVTLIEGRDASVEGAKTGIAVSFADNAALIKNATYSITEVAPVEGKAIASGALSINTIAAAEFDAPITFASGVQYELVVKAWKSEEILDENLSVIEPDFTATYTINGATDIEIALGEPQFNIFSDGEIDAASWEGIEISFPDNNLAEAAWSNEFEMKDVAVSAIAKLYSKTGTDETATIAFDGEDIAAAKIFAQTTLAPATAYTFEIEAGALKIEKIVAGAEADDVVEIWKNEEAITLSFSTLEAPEPLEAEVAVNGTELKITFAEGTDLGDNCDAELKITVVNAAGEVVATETEHVTDNTTGGFFDPLNLVIVTLDKELAAGEYSVVIPAGFYIVNGGSNNDELTFDFKVEEPEPELAETALTKNMFCTWDSYEANGNITAKGVGAYDLGVSTGLPYGDGSVLGQNYADLTGCSMLALTVTEGTPRLLFNRQSLDGSSSDFLEVKEATSEYVVKVEEGVWYINIAKITEDKGYAHLNCIKGANWANTTITEMTLLGTQEAIDAVGIKNVQTTVKANGKYMENGKVVIVRNGVKYNTNGVIVK